ncbi:hypothetical protein C8R43DRAFT_945962 [Mycena crocata]|nr:hypothetical protein C8R43DRAFT_945962 [Mycena crocata]
MLSSPPTQPQDFQYRSHTLPAPRHRRSLAAATINLNYTFHRPRNVPFRFLRPFSSAPRCRHSQNRFNVGAGATNILHTLCPASKFEGQNRVWVRILKVNGAILTKSYHPRSRTRFRVLKTAMFSRSVDSFLFRSFRYPSPRIAFKRYFKTLGGWIIDLSSQLDTGWNYGRIIQVDIYWQRLPIDRWIMIAHRNSISLWDGGMVIIQLGVITLVRVVTELEHRDYVWMSASDGRVQCLFTFSSTLTSNSVLYSQRRTPGYYDYDPEGLIFIASERGHIDLLPCPEGRSTFDLGSIRCQLHMNYDTIFDWFGSGCRVVERRDGVRSVDLEPERRERAPIILGRTHTSVEQRTYLQQLGCTYAGRYKSLEFNLARSRSCFKRIGTAFRSIGGTGDRSRRRCASSTHVFLQLGLGVHLRPGSSPVHDKYAARVYTPNKLIFGYLSQNRIDTVPSLLTRSRPADCARHSIYFSRRPDSTRGLRSPRVHSLGQLGWTLHLLAVNSALSTQANEITAYALSVPSLIYTRRLAPTVRHSRLDCARIVSAGQNDPTRRARLPRTRFCAVARCRSCQSDVQGLGAIPAESAREWNAARESARGAAFADADACKRPAGSTAALFLAAGKLRVGWSTDGGGLRRCGGLRIEVRRGGHDAGLAANAAGRTRAAQRRRRRFAPPGADIKWVSMSLWIRDCGHPWESYAAGTNDGEEVKAGGTYGYKEHEASRSSHGGRAGHVSGAAGSRETNLHAQGRKRAGSSSADARRSAGDDGDAARVEDGVLLAGGVEGVGGGEGGGAAEGRGPFRGGAARAEGGRGRGSRMTSYHVGIVSFATVQPTFNLTERVSVGAVLSIHRPAAMGGNKPLCMIRCTNTNEVVSAISGMFDSG